MESTESSGREGNADVLSSTGSLHHQSSSGLAHRHGEGTEESSKEGAGKAPARSASSGENDGQSRFICHICLNSPDKPIATVCGHLYCWGCIYKWLTLHRENSQCPVCKAGIEIPGGDVSKAKVIPLYVGETSQTDPRNSIPEDPSIPQRPAGERPEPQRSGFFQGWQGPFTPGAGYPQIVTNVGLFPSLFGLAFAPAMQAGMNHRQENFNPTGTGGSQTALEQQELAQQEFLSRLLFMIGTFIALCLIFFP